MEGVKGTHVPSIRNDYEYANWQRKSDATPHRFSYCSMCIFPQLLATSTPNSRKFGKLHSPLSAIVYLPHARINDPPTSQPPPPPPPLPRTHNADNRSRYLTSANPISTKKDWEQQAPIRKQREKNRGPGLGPGRDAEKVPCLLELTIAGGKSSESEDRFFTQM